MDCIVHGIAKSWTRLNDFHLLTHPPYLKYKLNEYRDHVFLTALFSVPVSTLYRKDRIALCSTNESNGYLFFIFYMLSSVGLQK